MEKVTIRSVAEKAGVSLSTVSRVLSNPEYPVSKKTIKAVMAAVEDLGYMPNMIAQRVRKTSLMDIGVIVPNITNPFYSLAILGIEQECRKQSYNILLCNSFRDRNHERHLLQSMHNNGVKGVIVSSMSHEGENIKEFSKKGMQFILLDQRVEGLDSNHISFSYMDGAKLAVEYLVEMGHRHICLATTPLTRWSRQEIYSGFRQALGEAGIRYNGETMKLVVEEETEENANIYENRSGQLLAEKFLKMEKRPTAVFCVNDMVAFGFIQELHDKGLQVPEDVSVVGVDDIPFAAMFSPALTTIHCPTVETGRMAAQMMIRKLNGEITVGFEMKLDAKLVRRKSVRFLFEK